MLKESIAKALNSVIAESIWQLESMVELNVKKLDYHSITKDIFARKINIVEDMLTRAVRHSTVIRDSFMRERDRRDTLRGVEEMLSRETRRFIDTCYRGYRRKLSENESELHSIASSRNINVVDVDRVQSLLENKVNPNAQDMDGSTPLHWAILVENLPVIRSLLLHGANLFIKNEEGKTPHDLSQEKELVKDLFLRDKDVNGKIRVQTHNRNIEELKKIEELKEKDVYKRLGKLDCYKYQNEITIRTGYPTTTLKELCIEKILSCINKAGLRFF